MLLTVPALFETTIESLPLEMLIVLDDSVAVFVAKTTGAHTKSPTKVETLPMLAVVIEVNRYLTLLEA